MYARIEHELSAREALEQARQSLLRKKQSLIADNKKRKEDLASLDKDLETFIDVSPGPHGSFGKQERHADLILRPLNRFKRSSKSSISCVQ